MGIPTYEHDLDVADKQIILSIVKVKLLMKNTFDMKFIVDYLTLSFQIILLHNDHELTKNELGPYRVIFVYHFMQLVKKNAMIAN